MKLASTVMLVVLAGLATLGFFGAGALEVPVAAAAGAGVPARLGS